MSTLSLKWEKNILQIMSLHIYNWVYPSLKRRGPNWPHGNRYLIRVVKIMDNSMTTRTCIISITLSTRKYGHFARCTILEGICFIHPLSSKNHKFCVHGSSNPQSNQINYNNILWTMKIKKRRYQLCKIIKMSMLRSMCHAPNFHCVVCIE